MDWFDSDYYHILYKHRDYSEARNFIDNIVEYIDLKKGSQILDLACGIGRHSIYLDKIGFKVVGTDKSPNNIKKAKASSNQSLSFLQMEMIDDTYHKYDCIFNLFTSLDGSSLKSNGYTGAHLGLYATSNGEKTKDSASFEYVNYLTKKK